MACVKIEVYGLVGTWGGEKNTIFSFPLLLIHLPHSNTLEDKGITVFFSVLSEAINHMREGGKGDVFTRVELWPLYSPPLPPPLLRLCQYSNHANHLRFSISPPLSPLPESHRIELRRPSGKTCILPGTYNDFANVSFKRENPHTNR